MKPLPVVAALVGEVRVVTRKGDILQARLRRQWPHHVALSGDKVRGHKNFDVVYTFAEAFSVAPRTFWVRRDDLDFVVFSFAKAEDAEAFSEQFGGESVDASEWLTCPLSSCAVALSAQKTRMAQKLLRR